MNQNKDIIVKQADNRGAADIMHRKYNSDEILEMLNDEETDSELQIHTDGKSDGNDAMVNLQIQRNSNE